MIVDDKFRGKDTQICNDFRRDKPPLPAQLLVRLESRCKSSVDAHTMAAAQSTSVNTGCLTAVVAGIAHIMPYSHQTRICAEKVSALLTVSKTGDTVCDNRNRPRIAPRGATQVAVRQLTVTDERT